MCGITGWTTEDPGKSHGPEDEALLSSMCGRIRHRGPDDQGVWLGEGAALGMRRLSVIDLETGEQPVTNEAGNVIAVMNGEIYNFLEIREELEKKGHRFTSRSDTEVLPHLYDEYGDALVDHLDGMFAFALWDKHRKRLLIARDRFGEKPLYYGVFGGRLFFASEPKSLFEEPGVSKELDPDAAFLYLSFDYVPAPHSIYKGIKKLPAGHLLKWESGDLSVRKYWDVSFEKREPAPSVAEAAEELIGILSASVRRRLVADVPLGVLLSGGIDSSTVAALSVKHSASKVKTFSIGFEEESFDESSHARLVADYLGTEHHEERLSVERAAGLVEEIGKWLDEPLSDGSLIPTVLLSSFVRKHVTVALGGDGGDEIFAGYPMYLGHKVNRLYRAVPKFVRSGIVEPAVAGLKAGTGNLTFDYKAKRFVKAADRDDIERHHMWFGSFSIEEKAELLSGPFADSVTLADTYSVARELAGICDAESVVERMQYLDMKLYLAEDILTKVDRASMAVSLEVRAPFLDHKVAEFSASLPAEYKLKGRTSKYILKKAVKGLLPDEIISRPKKGFGIPVAEWLKGRLNPLLRELLSEERLKTQGIFEPAYVSRLIAEHESGQANHYKQLWTLLVFQLWIENFLSS
ncbi:MAG: asparagine synthase (glutamine-hydrolyzing) [Acidobacteriota bacterium]|nr:MAG: asparagine synthase (glutamine-hydrolyzing) [Acidobacteriota bacterium]